MSKQAALTFREKLQDSAALQAALRGALPRGWDWAAAAAVAQQAGFACTTEDLLEAWSEVQQADALSEFELEMVAAGGTGITHLGADYS